MWAARVRPAASGVASKLPLQRMPLECTARKPGCTPEISCMASTACRASGSTGQPYSGCVEQTAGRARAFAPGRVNLIGEHTDYNDGLCLPFAIERGVTVTAEPGGPEPDDPFVRGATAELGLPPCRLTVESDLPQRAGLASSAAFTVAVCLALCAAAGVDLPDTLELARLCSRVENDWVGQPTGLLDQLACLQGEAGQALRLDMRSLDLEPVRLGLGRDNPPPLGSRRPRPPPVSGD